MPPPFGIPAKRRARHDRSNALDRGAGAALRPPPAADDRRVDRGDRDRRCAGDDAAGRVADDGANPDEQLRLGTGHAAHRGTHVRAQRRDRAGDGALSLVDGGRSGLSGLRCAAPGTAAWTRQRHGRTDALVLPHQRRIDGVGGSEVNDRAGGDGRGARRRDGQHRRSARGDRRGPDRLGLRSLHRRRGHRKPRPARAIGAGRSTGRGVGGPDRAGDPGAGVRRDRGGGPPARARGGLDRGGAGRHRAGGPDLRSVVLRDQHDHDDGPGGRNRLLAVHRLALPGGTRPGAATRSTRSG